MKFGLNWMTSSDEARKLLQGALEVQFGIGWLLDGHHKLLGAQGRAVTTCAQVTYLVVSRKLLLRKKLPTRPSMKVLWTWGPDVTTKETDFYRSVTHQGGHQIWISWRQRNWERSFLRDA